MALSDRKMFNDTKRRVASLLQLSVV